MKQQFVKVLNCNIRLAQRAGENAMETKSYYNSFIHSCIHIDHLHIAALQKNTPPNFSTVKRISLQMRKIPGDKVLGKNEFQKGTVNEMIFDEMNATK